MAETIKPNVKIEPIHVVAESQHVVNVPEKVSAQALEPVSLPKKADVYISEWSFG